MKQLTVFTPAYNRASLLERCYRSLQRQTNKDFVWYIIDDGSTDNTREVVSKWISENNDFEIRYYYKENGGLHTAYNEAIAHLETELAVCIDSDDFMPDNAVEITVYGDKKHVVRSALYKQVPPMKSFPGEKNFNPHYFHLEISRNYDFLIVNENLCYVDYQDAGMTNNMMWQYYNSPNSFAEIRLHYLSFDNLPLKFKLKSCVHYDSSCILAKRKHFIRQCPYRFIATLCVPFGFILSRIILLKNRKKKNQ